MAFLKLEVRDRFGTPLQKLCNDFFDMQLPIEPSRLAQSLLKLIRDGGQRTAYSVHFLREGEEIGTWSLDRERREAAVA